MNTTHLNLPDKGRDLRLDIFRGIANWFIFINHIPNNVVALITLRTFGFADDADLFVFISGYTAAFVYARIMLDRGFLAGAARLVRRAWQIYATHVFLLAFYLATVGAGALYFSTPPLEGSWGADYNLGVFVSKPVQTLIAALTLGYKPVNLDILPLYVVLMLAFPLVLWTMMREADLTLFASAVLWLAARHWAWNLPAYGSGTWYFNPFAWQFLFVFGSWCAMGGARRLAGLIRTRAFTIFGIAYLAFAFVMHMAQMYPEFAGKFPPGLVQPFIPNDKINFAPYRFLHFAIMAAFTVRVIPRGFAPFDSRLLKPAAWCGQKSLEVFALGTMLSYIAHFYLERVDGGPLSQIMVSALGVAIMCAFAYVITRWRRVEAGVAQPAQTVTETTFRPVESLQQI